MQETWVWSLGWEDPLEKEMQPTPVFLPGKSQEQRSLSGYSLWCCKRVRHNLLTKQQNKFTKNRGHFFICFHQSFQNLMAGYLFLGLHISFFSLSTFHGHLWYDQVQLKSGSVQTCFFKNYGWGGFSGRGCSGWTKMMSTSGLILKGSWFG